MTNLSETCRVWGDYGKIIGQIENAFSYVGLELEGSSLERQIDILTVWWLRVTEEELAKQRKEDGSGVRWKSRWSFRCRSSNRTKCAALDWRWEPTKEEGEKEHKMVQGCRLDVSLVIWLSWEAPSQDHPLGSHCWLRSIRGRNQWGSGVKGRSSNG